MKQAIEEVRATLQRFQDGYTARDATKLDKFMTWFEPDEDIELIGIGAEQLKGPGHTWPFTFVAVLIRSGEAWHFHMIHWSTPVD